MENRKIINLFIIEDNEMYYTALKQYLHTGFERSEYWFSIKAFRTSESCLEWLDCYNSIQPDIIILDYFLNSEFNFSMNGGAALFHLKANLPDAEVIFLSGQPNIDIAVETLQTGAFDYIVKDEHAFQKVANTVMNCVGDMRRIGKINTESKRRSVSQ